MELRLLWFVLAGFILGFATSMLWEWLYFRRHRAAVALHPLNSLRQPTASPYTLLNQARQPVAPSTVAAEYRSPGVFLESEQPAPRAAEASRRGDPALLNVSPPPAAPDPVPAIYTLEPTSSLATATDQKVEESEQERA